MPSHSVALGCQVQRWLAACGRAGQNGIDVGSLILDLSHKKVLTVQSWRDYGLLPRSTMQGEASCTTGFRSIGIGAANEEWLCHGCPRPRLQLRGLSGRALEGITGASVPVPATGAGLCIFLGVAGLRGVVST